MSSNSRLSEVTTVLEELLSAALPQTWRIANAEGGAVKGLVPVLFYEVTGFDTSDGGTQLPEGSLTTEVTLTLTAPETDPAKGTQTASECALDLCLALDSIPQVRWTRADKVRLEDGVTAFRFPITVLSNYNSEE